ncbi:MAG: hypothetical protein IJH12_03055 [Clostridia bacterium]|nr:hypothetical protein [Clostridia bacterium]
MNYKELYLKNEDRKYCEITGIVKEDVKLESYPIQKIKDNWIILLGIVALIIGFLLVKFNLKIFLLVIIFVVLFLTLFLIGNKYSVVCKKDGIQIKQHFQSVNLPYKSIKNVYIAGTMRSMILHTYVLVIRCEDQLSFLREFELPLLCSNVDEVAKFIENFKMAGESDAAALRLEKRRSLKRIVSNIFTLMCAIIIVWFCIVNGIIKLP